MDLSNIKSTLANLTTDKSMLDVLMEIERTIDELGLYSYDNWDLGELVSGPHIQDYWVETQWLYPYEKMPNPKGLLRLQKIGCKVDMFEDEFKKPHRIYKASDWENPMSKRASLEDVPVWIVKILMPRRYINMYIQADVPEVNDIGVELNDKEDI